MNIPIARASVGFFYLMFIPGMAILKLLELRNLDSVEKALIAIGLSISFLMLISVMINEIGRLTLSNPLSLNLLLFCINSVVLLISIIATRRDRTILRLLPELKRTEWLLLILLIISFFALGSYGTFMVIDSGNSLLLLLLIVASSIAVSLALLFEKITSKPCTLMLILLVLSVCVVLFVTGTLITKYVGGKGDEAIEFYAFRLTETKGFWDSTAVSSPYVPNLFPTYSMLSVTVLPMAFSVITGLDDSLIFKLIYPLVISFLALGTYKLYQTQTENKVAFLAAFFFFTISFGKGWGSYKQQIAQLFYILLFLLLFKKDFPSSKRNILFILLSIGLIISHYALTYIFLFIILLAFLILTLIKSSKTGYLSTIQTRIPLTLVLTFLTITFSWYVFVNASATFNLLNEEINTITSNLDQFFNLESRGTAIQGLGLIETPTIYHQISTALFIATEFLLVVGFLRLITSKNRDSKYSIEYKVIATINMAIIVMNILLPRLADTFLMSRFYQTTLIILAPMAILGGETIIRFLPMFNSRRLRVSILAIIIFVPLFLFQTGFVYEIAKVQNYSLALSMYRWDNITLYSYIVDNQEVASAQWLAKNSNTASISIYSDDVSKFSVLTSYGMMERGRVHFLSNSTILASDEFIYLASVNLISEGYIFNATEIGPIIEGQNKIYSNGESEICKGYTP